MVRKLSLSALFGGLAAIGALISVDAWATPISGSSLQTVLNNITTAPVAGVSSVDVDTDQVADDDYWAITGAGLSGSTLIIELAGFAANNIFGVYDAADPTKQVVLFAGSAVAGDQVVFSIKADGSVFINIVNDTGVDFAGNAFGFFLDANGGGASVDGLFFSDTTLNSDLFDHMVAFQGKNIDTIQTPGNLPGLWTDNEFILAWEDLTGGGDTDYDDMVLIIESVIPVPEPGTLALLGAGLLGLGWLYGRRNSA